MVKASMKHSGSMEWGTTWSSVLQTDEICRQVRMAVTCVSHQIKQLFPLKLQLLGYITQHFYYKLATPNSLQTVLYAIIVIIEFTVNTA